MNISKQDNTDELTLSVSKLSCIRDDRVLFEGLDFQLSSGQVLLIEGPNGCGKTSLLRILCGIRREDSGEVLWQRKPITILGSQYREHLTYIGHHNGVKDLLTVEENLTVSRAMGSANQTTIEQALEKVGLLNFTDVMAQSLSAGQRRRLALARLLVTDASLWVLDEPFTALDKDGIKNVESLIDEYIQSGGMVVMTSHHELNLNSSNVVRLHLG
jgi:heme exporter protein A